MLSEEQLEHGLSIVFPDVRLKQYVEIRVGDSMPLEYTMSYIALLKGMFWNRDELYKLYKELEQFTPSGHMTQEDVRQGKDQLITWGYQGKIYGKPAGFWLERMFRLAGQQLEEEERTYLQPMQRLVQAGKSVRDRNE